jgi:chemotaxis protein CheX
MTTMDQSIRPTTSPLSEVEDHLSEATTELFDAYGIPIGRVSAEVVPVTANGITVTSTVGFAGENLRGALVISTSLDAVQRWQLQLGGSESTSEMASDTIGEFSNMLLGRLKYSLLLRGVTILLATPTTAMGRQMTLPPPPGCPSRWLRFDGDAGRVDVRLDISFTPDFAFATEAPREAPAGAGDRMMF